MRIAVNVRDKGWWKGMLAAGAMLALAVFFLGAGVALKETGLAAVGGVGTALFGAIAYMMLRPSLHVSMGMVKGEMSYRELREAIAAEEFEESFRFVEGGVGDDGAFRPGKAKPGKRRVFLVSQNWAVFGIAETPIYVPKSKVRSVKMLNWPVALSSGQSRDGGVPDHYVLRFRCDGGQEFDTGLIPPEQLPKARELFARHFPDVPVEI